MSGNVGDVGEQRAVPLHGIDQVAAHFSAGNGFPVYLESVNLKRKRWNQSRLYAVREGKFGLHADGRDAFGQEDIDEHPIPDDRAHEDADGVEDDSTVHRLQVRRRGRMKGDTNRQPQAGRRNQQKNRDETKPPHAGRKNGCSKRAKVDWPEKASTQGLVVEQQQIDDETDRAPGDKRRGQELPHAPLWQHPPEGSTRDGVRSPPVREPCVNGSLHNPSPQKADAMG